VSRSPIEKSGKAWKTLGRRTVLSRPPWYEIEEERVELPNGSVIDAYTAMRLRDYVTVVALTPARDLLIERMYKHGPRDIVLDLPSGLIEDGEAPLPAAQRELLEETGHRSDKWTPLGTFVVNSNYGGGRMHAFLALDVERVREPNSGDLEEMELLQRPFTDALAGLRRGEFKLLSAAATIALAAIRLADA